MIPNQKAVLFDLDGVVALTEHLKAKAHLSTIEQLGGSAHLNDYLHVMGGSHEAVRDAMIRAGGAVIDPQAYTNLFRQTYQQLIDGELEIRPGIAPLVEALKLERYLTGVVSSSTGPVVEWVIEKAGLTDILDIRISANDVQNKKPDPEPYQKAMSALKVQPVHTLVFEDTYTGIVSAIQAGAKVIAVRHPQNALQDLTFAEVVVDSFIPTSSLITLIAQILR
jgi:HAD superfamily hydrolase (TIGR01509 family)